MYELFKLKSRLVTMAIVIKWMNIGFVLQWTSKFIV
jgi:hypothetical protein